MVTLVFIGESKVKGYIPPIVEWALIEEDKDFFYGWEAGADATMRKLNGIMKMSKSEWKLTWRKSKQA